MLLNLRQAFRSLVKTPSFTGIALLTLALGIGVNTTSFSVLNALLMHTVPYPEPHRLVRVYRTSPQSQSWPHSAANFLDHQVQNTVFERMAAINRTNFNLSEPGQPAERLPGQAVTADFFPLLGVQPILGRYFAPSEDQPGHNGVVVLSYDTWQQHFGGATDILDRPIRVNGETVTVIGVMPESFVDVQLWGTVAMWQPMAFTDEVRQSRGRNYLSVIARLKPEVSLEQAQAAMSGLAAQLALAHPDHNAQNGLRLVDLGTSTQDGIGRGVTWLVMGLAGFVLLIACANLANLQFARNAARIREQAIRAALGASQAQLIGQVLMESILLSLVGGAIGLIMALWSNDLIGRHFVWGDHVGLNIPVDLRVLGFTLVVSVLTGILFGILPAWLASRANVNDALKQGSRGSTTGRSQHRLRHALIVIEVALALTLLAGAGFFIRGLDRFAHREVGWRTDGILTATLNLRGEQYKGDSASTDFYNRLHDRLVALPGVEQVTMASSLPVWGYDSSSTIVAEGRPEPAPGQAPLAQLAMVRPGFFSTFDIPLLQGRDFSLTDLKDTPDVVIVNETMAQAFWPGESPLGKRIGDPSPFMSDPAIVVGVVRSVRSASLNTPDTNFQMYFPIAQHPINYASIALRTNVAPETLAQPLRMAIAELDPDQAVYRIDTLKHKITQGLASIGVAAWALLWFALLGVLLAAIGIYGVIANSVAQRTNEIGIRLALGSQVSGIFKLILGNGLRLALLGVAFGLVGAFGLARLLRAISPEISGANVGLTVGVTLFLLLIASAACYFPARRATKVNPIEALRAE
ncbi:MAG: ABC transporter permease [Cephaloticoccus sp.]|nr:ABC transporter permease [Cephaloticoccus sp.]